MMKSIVFLVVFISTYILVQGIDQQSSNSQCNCCDQCDHSAASGAAVSQLLLGLSNMLAVDDPISTTSKTSTTTAASSTTIGVLKEETTTTALQPASTEHPAIDNSTAETPTATQVPLTAETTTTNEIPSSTETTTTARTPSTTENPTTTQAPSTISYSSDARDSQVASIDVDPLPIANSSSKLNPIVVVVVNVPADTDFITTSTTVSPFTTVAAVTSAKTPVCPDKCYLDITGVYCNCYDPAEVVRADS